MPGMRGPLRSREHPAPYPQAKAGHKYRGKWEQGADVLAPMSPVRESLFSELYGPSTPVQVSPGYSH